MLSLTTCNFIWSIIIYKHVNNGVWNSKHSAFTVQSFTRISAWISDSGIFDDENTFAILVCWYASWLITNMTPIESPVNERMGKSRRFALNFNGFAHIDCDVSGWSANNSWLFFTIWLINFDSINKNYIINNFLPHPISSLWSGQSFASSQTKPFKIHWLRSLHSNSFDLHLSPGLWLAFKY